MSEPAWKVFERRIASRFNGIRRGAGTSQNGNGKTDVISPGWAIECKLLSRPSFQQMLDAARQAEKNVESIDDIPIAIVKRKGDNDDNAVVVIRLEVFQQWFVGA
jgi:hypothetical protein